MLFKHCEYYSFTAKQVKNVLRKPSKVPKVLYNTGFVIKFIITKGSYELLV